MSELKHTPGPWVVDQVAAFADPEDGHMIYAKSGNGHIVCEIRHAYADNQTANARLIAAAPELLEMLIELRGCLVNYDGHVTDITNRDGWDSRECYEAYMKATEVIKKATS